MITIPRLGTGAQLAVGAFGLLSLIGACLIARHGGFMSDTGGTGDDHVFVSGPPAVVMALIQLSGAWAAFAAVLAQTWSRGMAILLSLVFVALPPVVLVTM